MTYNPKTKQLDAEIEIIPKGTLGNIVDTIIEQEGARITEKWKKESRASRENHV